VRAPRWLRALVLRFYPRLFARIFTPDARELGLVGEEFAVHELLARGFVIVARRVQTAHAEVDVLAREGRDLVCVEVKTTRYEPLPIPRGSGLDIRPARFRESGRLGAVQTARLVRAARALRRGSDAVPRVDLVEVFLNARSGAVKIEHRRNLTRKVEGPSRLGGRDLRESL